MDKPDFNAIPLTPGVYLFKDADGRILYVGKAKVLRRRLASYFRDEHLLAPKTRVMTQQAASLETISTVTEKEALLLEASLIKKHRPRYNIVLRDDKEYVLFRIDGEHPYPRLEITRKARTGKKNGRVRLFGPFSSAGDAKATWKAVHRIFPLRRCNDRAFKNRSKPCLYYHMGQCAAPCVLEVDKEAYAAMLKRVELLLSGRSRELVQQLEGEMRADSDALRFEQAAALRDQIRAIEKTVERQAVVLPFNQDIDVLGVAEASGGLALGLLFVRQGVLLGGRSFFWSGLALENASELILSFMSQFYAQAGEAPPRVIAPFIRPGGQGSEESDEAGWAEDLAALEDFLTDLRRGAGEKAEGGPVRLLSPKGPDEERLVNLAATNAREYAKNMRHSDLSEILAQRLGGPRPVRRVEAVDISHISGTDVRAGLVVFEDGKPMREDWRSYDLYSLEEAGNGGARNDDYTALAEWAGRRVGSGPPWPDLLLVDGGKGQLNAVCRALSEAFAAGPGGQEPGGVFPLDYFVVAGIAKARDDDEEGKSFGRAIRRAGNVEDRIFLPGRSNPLPLRPGSPELLFLQHVRDNAHDFVLGRHRQARGRRSMLSELERIPGVGPKFAALLWERFGSIKAMAEANEEELRSVPGIGREKAKALKEHLGILVGPS